MDGLLRERDLETGAPERVEDRLTGIEEQLGTMNGVLLRLSQ